MAMMRTCSFIDSEAILIVEVSEPNASERFEPVTIDWIAEYGERRYVEGFGEFVDFRLAKSGASELFLRFALNRTYPFSIGCCMAGARHSEEIVLAGRKYRTRGDVLDLFRSLGVKHG